MISVIIPLYNAAQWMQYSIESVMNQSYKEWELILVDDGSIDDTLSIAKKYSQKDGRIRVFHQENGGVTRARHTGFLHSYGDKILFLDADDSLKETALERLSKYMTKNHVDIVKCAEQIVNRKSTFPLLNKVTGYYENKEYMEVLVTNQIIGTLHASLYSRTLFDEKIFNIDPQYKLGEDIYMNVMLANRCHSAFISNDIIYDYHYNETSAMQTQVMSYEYHERIGRLIRQTIQESTPRIESYLKYGRVRTLIHCFFVPEISFSKERYVQLKKEMGKADVHSYIKHNIEKRYIRFIHIQWMFKLYTILYRYAYLIFRQHGIKKKLIY